MKKILLTLLILGLVTGSGYAVSNAVERGYISINASANTEIAPDVAEISIAVLTYDSKSMQKATIENKQISEKVISALKGMIDTSKGDYVKTSDYNASPIYNYVNNKRVLDKYQVSNSVIVHTKNIDKIGDMIDKSIALGATNVNSLNFSVSNYENQCNDLLVIATKKAHDRANVVLKAAQSEITGVRSLDVNCSTNNAVRPQYRYMKANVLMDTASGAEQTATTIEQGVVKVYANVNASFFVK